MNREIKIAPPKWLGRDIAINGGAITGGILFSDFMGSAVKGAADATGAAGFLTGATVKAGLAGITGYAGFKTEGIVSKVLYLASFGMGSSIFLDLWDMFFTSSETAGARLGNQIKQNLPNQSSATVTPTNPGNGKEEETESAFVTA